MKLKSWIVWIFIVSLLFIGCSSSSSPKSKKEKVKKIRIEFWHANSGKHGKLIEKFVKEFNKLHPNIQVIPVYQGSYTSLYQKLLASIQAGNPPVITQLYESWTSMLIKANKLVCIQDYIDKDPQFKKDVSDFIEIFRRNNSWGGKLYTLPFNKSCYVFFVNLDMLKQVGYETAPKNWNELLDAAKKLTVKKGKNIIRYGIGLRPTIETFSYFYYQNGGNYFDKDGNLKIYTKEAVEALQFLVDLVNKYKVAYVDPGYMSQPFGSEKIAMYIGSSAGIPFVNRAVKGDNNKPKFNWMTFTLPEGKRKATLFQGTNIGILKTGRGPKVEKAAYEFIKFLTDKKHNLEWSIETGYVPIRYSVLKDPKIQEYLKKNPYYKAVISQYDYGFYDPRMKKWSNIRPIVQAAVEKALHGTLSPDEALKEAQKKAEEELKK